MTTLAAAPGAPTAIQPLGIMPADTQNFSSLSWELKDLEQQIAQLSAGLARLEQALPAPVAAPVAQPVAQPVAPPVAPPAPPQAKPKPEPKAKPKPETKPETKPEPKSKEPKEDAKYASRLRSNLHGAYWKASIQCFRYAWNVVGKSGGRSIGRATQSRDGRGKSTAYLGEMVRTGRIKVGDIVYINKKPGADPTSTILSYKPHWFVYIGKGQFADQFGERDAAAMDRFFAGRKIDTIYRTN